MARTAYKCDISIKFIHENKETNIDQSFVKYIMVEHLYESRYMPVIYLSLSVTNELYSSMIDNEKTAKIYLKVRRKNIYSDTSILKKYIEGQFTYILSTSNPNYTQDISDENNMDNSYKTITIALISMEIMNKIKTSFNGIFGEVDQSTLILKALEGLNAVVKKPLYNPTYETIIIPALNSKTKLIQFLFDECPFYDTKFMFFTDFDKTYLLDLSGDACDGRDNQLSTVILDIKEVTTEQAYYEGMEEKNGAYYIYINPANTNITENKSSDKVTNQLVFIDDLGGVEAVDIEINKNVDSTVKQSFIRGDNSVLYKNILESNTIVMELYKENIDSLVLTPNKQYMVSNYTGYQDYNGKYTLLYKKEVIKNINGEFGITVSLGLKKVGNITAIGSSVVAAAVKKNKSATGRYRVKNTTAKKPSDKKSNTGNVVKPMAKKNNSGATTIDLKVIPKTKRIKATNDSMIRRDVKSM